MSPQGSGSSRQPAVSAGRGCVLRPWDLGDAAELRLSQHDPLIRRYATRLVGDQHEAVDVIQGWNRRWAEGRGGAWALRADGSGADPAGDLLGAIQYGQLDEDLGLGSVGYWLLAHARGRGLASAALTRSSPVVFERLGWHRIELSHAVENERSCAVARRSGYLPEGVMRDAMRYPDAGGRWSDEHRHARLSTDPPVTG